MAVSFPTSLDSFTDVTMPRNLGDAPLHSDMHNDIQDAVEALEVKVGIDSSADTASFDYRIAALEAAMTAALSAITAQQIQIGGLYISTDSTNPATGLGYGTWSAFGAGKVLVGIDVGGDTAFDTSEETGGSKTGTPSGTVSQPTFTGSALTGHTHGTGTYANSSDSAGTPSGTIAWPGGVPTAANESAHTHSVTSNVSAANHSFTQPTIAWPAGVPTFSGSAMSQHQHELPMQLVSNVLTRHISAATFGTGTSRAAIGQIATTANTTSAAVAMSGGVTAGTPAGTIAWPAGVPTNSGGAVNAHSLTNNAVTSGAGSAHTHTLSWPAGVPTFTGDALSKHTHTMSGSSSSDSAGTPAGTVSQPTFTGNSMSIVQPYIVVYMWKRTA